MASPTPGRVGGANINRTAGYLLIEVLITLSVSLLALSALIKFQGELFQGDTLARARSHAAFLAEQRLETLYAAIPGAGVETTSTGTDTLTADLSPAVDTTAAYTRSWTVTAGGEAGTAQVEVTVTWTDPADNSYDVRLASLIDPVAVSFGAPGLVARDFIRLE